MFSISNQIEYIAGAKWNAEYNNWLVDYCGCSRAFKYHYMSRINWHRQFKRFHVIHRQYIIDLVSAHPDITWDIVQANPNISWEWNYISRNPNITWDIIQANPTKPWHWMEISLNPNITWDIIQANPDKPWEWNPRPRITTKGECPFGIMYQ